MAAEEKPGRDLESDFQAPSSDPGQEAPPSQPGGELFGDVVGEKGPRRKAARPDAPAESDGPLRDSVKGLYDMVKDLEVQLNHMISINEAAERDLDAARRTHRALEKEKGELLRKIEKMELDAQSGADLREEARHMAQENERLVERLRAVEEELERQKGQRTDFGAVVAQLKKERSDLREEIECQEAQLLQATDYIKAVREELAKARESRERETRKVELIEQRLHVVAEERDALKRELNESRAALEEIKRSIMDTNAQSQITYYES